MVPITRVVCCRFVMLSCEVADCQNQVITGLVSVKGLASCLAMQRRGCPRRSWGCVLKYTISADTPLWTRTMTERLRQECHKLCCGPFAIRQAQRLSGCFEALAVDACAISHFLVFDCKPKSIGAWGSRAAFVERRDTGNCSDRHNPLCLIQHIYRLCVLRHILHICRFEHMMSTCHSLSRHPLSSPFT